ncbi:chorismate--pyruvate lyase family protein [Xenorhabdus thailandensis]|uniref:chorismate--pyruvate lyase family protein n=1 Tax=Xenorhabdus thailandensis TaxID=3136255 RepID=UPI0030F4555A
MENLTNWSIYPTEYYSEIEIFWLSTHGSLTSKLRTLGDYSIELINQWECPATSHDARILNLSIGSSIWIREVLMCIDNTPCVTARSLTSIQSLQHDWIELTNYGSSPLGNILYNDKTIQRSAFEYAFLVPGDPLEKLSREFDNKEKTLIARRSKFSRNDSILCISECFLNTFWNGYANNIKELSLDIYS